MLILHTEDIDPIWLDPSNITLFPIAHSNNPHVQLKFRQYHDPNYMETKLFGGSLKLHTQIKSGGLYGTKICKCTVG